MRAIDRFVGGKVRAARRERGLSLDELARRVPCSPERLTAYEFGWRRPAPATLLRLAEALSLSVGHFFRDLDIQVVEAEHARRLPAFVASSPPT